MCGICGLVNFGRATQENIERMKERMVHRGPDAGGTWLSEDGVIGLGHRRLSILELSEKGAQPMHSHSGRFVLVYNGEIYNHGEIAERLRQEGRLTALRGTSDSEILLEALEAWGPEQALSRCKGMFAFALYDRSEKVLTLARDRIGEKPLYYGFAGSAFTFASDLGCIAALDDFDRKIDPAVLDPYFTHGYIPAPYTIYQGIYKLLPGSILTLRAPFGPAQLKTNVYWSILDQAKYGAAHPFAGSRQEASEELERLVRASVRDQMISDVPLGAFLSAGIDSPTIVSLMQAQSMKKVRTFTIGMAEKDYNEAEIAGQIAAHLGTDHTEMMITEQDAMNVIPLIPRMFAEPFADSSQIPTYLVSALTKQHVTVSLSGDAGDELFCGYTTYASVERIRNRYARIPAPLRSLGSSLILNSPLQKKEALRIQARLMQADCPEEIYRRSFDTDPLTHRIAIATSASLRTDALGPDELGNPCRDLMLMDLMMYHPDDILVKVDRTAMAVSLETRIPLLDRDVVEFAMTLPTDYLRDPESGKGKLVLRDILYKYVPREMMERPKKGFGIPIASWLSQEPLRSWAQELLREDTIRQQGLLNPEIVRQIYADFTGRGVFRPQLWYLLMFQAWMRDEHGVHR